MDLETHGGPDVNADLPREILPANDNHQAANDNRPPLSFAERIAKEWQRHDQGPSLP
jgi:hypothetical protein